MVNNISKTLFLAFFLLLLGFTYSETINPNISLDTVAPITAPYFIGTEINSVSINFDKVLNNKSIEVIIGKKTYSLYKIKNCSILRLLTIIFQNLLGKFDRLNSNN